MSLRGPLRWGAAGLGGALLVLLALPLVGLLGRLSPDALARGLSDPRLPAALGLSLGTTALAVTAVVLTGTPLAWWLATSARRRARAVEALVALPIVVPPAVIGVALLAALGRRGLFGPALEAVGLSLAFRTSAVVLAQAVVAAPFFVQAATNAFREVDVDLMLVARTLGASPMQAFLRVALPVARRGLLGGVGLAAARALGEFGATLLFAGNLPGRTQTMPLAIYSALETDVEVAVVLSLVLVVLGATVLGGLRALGGLSGWAARRP